ncbi:hypothetical protein [Leminorella grimontii]|uniref:hypothetical protein n=1 Tax=Leminorella grimontii TaxID=82981 RepID=UPI00321F7826
MSDRNGNEKIQTVELSQLDEDSAKYLPLFPSEQDKLKGSSFLNFKQKIKVIFQFSLNLNFQLERS